MEKLSVGEFYTELFYAIIPILFPYYMTFSYCYTCYFFFFTSGNRTPNSRSYADLVDTWAQCVCIHQLVLKTRSKVVRIMAILAIWLLSGSVLLRCFFAALGVLLVMKTLKDEWS